MESHFISSTSSILDVYCLALTAAGEVKHDNSQNQNQDDNSTVGEIIDKVGKRLSEVSLFRHRLIQLFLLLGLTSIQKQLFHGRSRTGAVLLS